MKPVEIRILGVKDIAVVIDISKEIFKPAGDTYHKDEMWKSYIENGGLLLGAYLDNKLVGYKFGYNVDNHEFHSWMGGVLPDYRGHHIATELMKYQEKWAKDNGYKILTTNTYKEKFPVMYDFLKTHGYTVVKEETKSEGENLVHKSYFSKHL